MATQQELDKLNQIKPVQGVPAITQQNVTTNPATLGSSAQQLGQQASPNMGAPTKDWTPQGWQNFENEQAKIKRNLILEQAKLGATIPSGILLSPLIGLEKAATATAQGLGLIPTRTAMPVINNQQQPTAELPNVATKASDIGGQAQKTQAQQAALFQPYRTDLSGLRYDPNQVIAPNINYGTPNLSINREALTRDAQSLLENQGFRTDISNVSSAINKYLTESQGKLSASDAEKAAALDTIKNLRQGAGQMLTEENLQSKSFAGGLIDIGKAKGKNRQATSLQDAVNKMIAQDRVSAQNAINTLQGQDISTQQQKALQDARFSQQVGTSLLNDLSGLETKLADYGIGVEKDKVQTQKDLFKMQQERQVEADKFNRDLLLKQELLNLPENQRTQTLGLAQLQALTGTPTQKAIAKQVLEVNQDLQPKKPVEEKQVNVKAFTIGDTEYNLPQNKKDFDEAIKQIINSKSSNLSNIANPELKAEELKRINELKAQIGMK